MSIGYLVEREERMRVVEWIAEGTADVWYSVLDEDVQVLARVTNNEGTGESLYLEVADLATVQADIATWFYDRATWTLYVHVFPGDDARTRVIYADNIEFLCYGPTLVKDRDGLPIVWDGRLAAAPNITMAVGTDDLGARPISLGGRLRIDNGDGLYDTRFAARLVDSQPIRVYRGDLDGALTSMETWLSAFQGAASVSTTDVTIEVVSHPSLETTTRQPDDPDQYDTYDQSEGIGQVYRYPARRPEGQPSGLWSLGVFNGALDIQAVYTSDGTSISFTFPITPPLGVDAQFEVDAAYDDDEFLYVDYFDSTPGSPSGIIRRFISLLWVLPGASVTVDEAAMDLLDEFRPLTMGMTFQYTQTSFREILDRAATSGFYDWFFKRDGTVSALARRRDTGNLVLNPGFEDDTDGWDTHTATLTRITTQHAEGDASGQIVKLAADTTANAFYRLNPTDLVAGRRYVVTCLALLVSGSTAAFRISVADNASEYFSDAVTLSSAWQRVTFEYVQAAAPSVITFDRTDITFDMTSVTFDEGSIEVRFYPQYAGGSDVTVAIDAVEVVPVILADDSNCTFNGMETGGVVLRSVGVAYGPHDAFPDAEGASDFERALVTVENAETVSLYPLLAEARLLDSDLATQESAEIVAEAILDYYSAPRLKVDLTILEWTNDQPVEIGSVIYLQTTRRPQIVNGSNLYRVTALSEGDATPPEIAVTAETHNNPMVNRLVKL